MLATTFASATFTIVRTFASVPATKTNPGVEAVEPGSATTPLAERLPGTFGILSVTVPELRFSMESALSPKVDTKTPLLHVAEYGWGPTLIVRGGAPAGSISVTALADDVMSSPVPLT
jgi:hypothetical protein